MVGFFPGLPDRINAPYEPLRSFQKMTGRTFRSRGRASQAPAYTTRKLAPETWPDFEKLFAKHGGVQAGCWCMFYHRGHPIPGKGLSREARAARNRADKETLTEQGRSHGILVYAGDQPVGWCQYGPRQELPRIDTGRNYRKLTLPKEVGKLWRITCFFVDSGNRRQGVASIALRAALTSIKAQGGGVVEAYPATNKGAVAIWFGTTGMFEAEGFKRVCDLGRSNIVMRKKL